MKQGETWIDLRAIEMSFPGDILSSLFVIGDDENAASPVVTVNTIPPDGVIAAHTHPCDYAEIMIEGSVRIGRRWHSVGEARVVRAGIHYGPLVAGPEGCRFISIFANRNWTPIASGASADGLYGAEADRRYSESR